MTKRGFKDATTDPERIKPWWKRWPAANIGGVTGAAAGCVVLDLDPRNGSDKSISEVEAQHGVLPKTPWTRTGGGGRHLFFRHPGGIVRSCTEILPGVDVKADGGYVVLPPSLHGSGKRYTWEKDTSIVMAPMPPWLVELLAPSPARTPENPFGDGSLSRYAERALRDECDGVRSAGKGIRNACVNRAAFSLGQLVGAGMLERSRVEIELFDAAVVCGLVAEDGESKTRATLRSGLEAGIKAPRSIPERAAPLLGASCQRTPKIVQGHMRTDMGNAERLATRCSDRLRYCFPWQQWLVWDGRRWARDRTGDAVRMAKDAVRLIYAEAANAADDETRKGLAQHAARSENQRRIVAMLELAKSDPRIAVLPEQFDGDGTRYLLNVLNGTLDLEKGELRAHDPADYITRLAPVEFRPGARSDRWESFLGVVLPDGGVRAYLQRFAGYALTGDVREQVFVLAHGPGANGKSVFLETLKGMLGDYGHKAEFSTFLRSFAQERKGAPRPDVIQLIGKRLVIANESAEGRTLDVATVKELTGNDTISARGLYSGQIEFRPQTKIILAANHRPKITDHTEAIWRRVHEVPFTVTIPERERDGTLPDKLRDPDELAGVLSWAFDGCRAWQAMGGLKPPEAVIAATRAFRNSEDFLSPFLEAKCERDPSSKSNAAALFRSYTEWCAQIEEEAASKKAFGLALEQAGFQPVRKPGSGARQWAGLRLNDMLDGDAK